MSDDLASFLSSSFVEYKTPPPPRLQSLYSEIYRQKESNPEGFKSSIGWWTRTLERIVVAGKQPHSDDHLVLHASNELVDALRWEKAGRPVGLGAVVEELASSQQLIALGPFLKSPTSIYRQPSLTYRVASYVIGAPIWWAFSQLSLGDQGASLSSEQRWTKFKGDYVMLSALKAAGDAVLAHQRAKPQNITEVLYNRHSFLKEFNSIAVKDQILSNLDQDVLIKYLERDKGAIIVEDDAIKFIDGLDSVAVEEGITEIDLGVLEMKSTLQKLDEQILEIESQIQGRLDKIRDLLGRGSKTLAMSYLRSKKQLEELLVKRLGSQETLQAVLSKIEMAATDIEIMKAYETSAKTLRSVLQHPSLQMESIEATMENMSDALADHKEIEDAIGVGSTIANEAAGVSSPDEDELAEELAGLVKEQEEEKEQARVLRELEAKAKQREEVPTSKSEANLPVVGSPVRSGDDWQRRYDEAQKDKAAQTLKDQEAERQTRQRWEEAEKRKVAEVL